MTQGDQARTLSHSEARSFYDGFGAKQDRQSFYEQVAIDELCSHAGFADSSAVLELGCGTGKLAKRLLEEELGEHARYLGLDLSSTMVGLARERTAPFGDRAEIRQTFGSLLIDAPDGSFDRFVSCYVLDLLSVEDIQTLLGEVHRVLVPGGLLCTASLTHGTTFATRIVSWSWARLHARSPKLVGGCRPIEVRPHLATNAWTIQLATVASAFGVPSEFVVAARSAT